MARQQKPVALRKRSEFLTTAAHAQKWVTQGFVLQMAVRPATSHEAAGFCGFGLTASKKTMGIAVTRNRARRRLRALAHEILPQYNTDGRNFVFIARQPSLTRSMDELRKDLGWALKRLGLEKREGA